MKYKPWCDALPNLCTLQTERLCVWEQPAQMSAIRADVWRPPLGAAYEEERVTSSGDLSTAQSTRRRGRKLAYNYMHHYSLMYGCFVELQPLSNLITHYSCWSDLLRKRQLSGFFKSGLKNGNRHWKFALHVRFHIFFFTKDNHFTSVWAALTSFGGH